MLWPAKHIIDEIKAFIPAGYIFYIFYLLTKHGKWNATATKDLYKDIESLPEIEPDHRFFLYYPSPLHMRYAFVIDTVPNQDHYPAGAYVPPRVIQEFINGIPPPQNWVSIRDINIFIFYRI